MINIHYPYFKRNKIGIHKPYGPYKLYEPYELYKLLFLFLKSLIKGGTRHTISCARGQRRQRWKQIIAKPINNVAPTRTCKGNQNKPSSGMIIGIKATAPAGAKNFPKNSNKENIQRKIGSTTTTSGKCKYLCPTI